MQKNYTYIYIYICLSLLFLIISNVNYSMTETLLFVHATDGEHYFQISEASPFFAKNMQYIKGERFFWPYIIGIFSKYSDFDLFLTYKIFTLILLLYLIKIFTKILQDLKLSTSSIILSISLILFNPYLFRYFLTIPTMVGDLLFIISTLIIFNGLLKKKKLSIFFGFFISLLTRQNAIIFLISFFISKLIFRDRSMFSKKDLLYFSAIFLLIFSINSFYAFNAASEHKQIYRLYYDTLFGIITYDYSFKEFLQFIIFPFLSFGPILFLFLSKKINSYNIIDNELLIIFILTFLGILAVAFLGGPVITGKNLIRLSNFIYPSLIILINLVFFENINIIKNKIYLIFCVFIFFIWSLHPTFSKIKIFDSFKVFFS